MANKEAAYKLSMSGGDITVKERPISEELARRIITIIMGGTVTAVTERLPDTGQGNYTPTPTTGHAEQLGHPTPRQFMSQKKPASWSEHLACLAYYLAHYRDTHQFKTRELTKLNTEAAQPSMSNAAVFARNSVQAQYLSKAGGGTKQITPLGEGVVEALPDREKVKKAIEELRNNHKRGTKRSKKKSKTNS